MNLDFGDTEGNKNNCEKVVVDRTKFEKIKYFDLKFELNLKTGDLWAHDISGNAYVFSQASIQSAIEVLEEIAANVTDVQEEEKDDEDEPIFKNNK